MYRRRKEMPAATYYKPRLFVGSSVESLNIAQAIQSELRFDFTVELWSQGIFTPSKSTIEDLLFKSRSTDYGVFVLAPNDVARIRGREEQVARDNVLFELGMFFGALDRTRTFFLIPQDLEGFHLPTDLVGLTSLTYDARDLRTNAQAAVGPACTAIRNVVSQQLAFAPVTPGLWRQTWRVEKETGVQESDSDAELIVIASRVKAIFEWNRRKFVLDGDADGRYLTGTWRDSIPGPGYHGAFQLEMAPTGEEMSGRWVGWSRGGLVRSGSWNWTFVGDSPADGSDTI
jgi:hypothetical protein